MEDIFISKQVERFIQRTIQKCFEKKKLLGRHNKGISLKICRGLHFFEMVFKLLFKNEEAATEGVPYLGWSFFLIQNTAEFLKAPILKKICERQLLKKHIK